MTYRVVCESDAGRVVEVVAEAEEMDTLLLGLVAFPPKHYAVKGDLKIQRQVSRWEEVDI